MCKSIIDSFVKEETLLEEFKRCLEDARKQKIEPSARYYITAAFTKIREAISKGEERILVINGRNDDLQVQSVINILLDERIPHLVEYPEKNPFACSVSLVLTDQPIRYKTLGELEIGKRFIFVPTKKGIPEQVYIKIVTPENGAGIWAMEKRLDYKEITKSFGPNLEIIELRCRYSV
jgi:hypothetical protein